VPTNFESSEMEPLNNASLGHKTPPSVAARTSSFGVAVSTRKENTSNNMTKQMVNTKRSGCEQQAANKMLDGHKEMLGNFGIILSTRFARDNWF
jgi:hypothetical protein